MSIQLEFGTCTQLWTPRPFDGGVVEQQSYFTTPYYQESVPSSFPRNARSVRVCGTDFGYSDVFERAVLRNDVRVFCRNGEILSNGFLLKTYFPRIVFSGVLSDRKLALFCEKDSIRTFF